MYSKKRCAQELFASFGSPRETCKDKYSDDKYRFLFEPSPGLKHPTTKHQEFVEYFKEEVKIANITAKVDFQKRVNIIPGQCILYFHVLCTSTVIIYHMWQSQVEIKYYSVQIKLVPVQFEHQAHTSTVYIMLYFILHTCI